LGHFTREITLNNEYLSQFLPDSKVLCMTLKQLFESFIKLPIFDSSRAICVLLRGQNQLLIHLGEERPKNLKKFTGLPTVALNRSKAQAKDVRKLH